MFEHPQPEPSDAPLPSGEKGGTAHKTQGGASGPRLFLPFHKADTPCALPNFRQHTSAGTSSRTGHRPFPPYRRPARRMHAGGIRAGTVPAEGMFSPDIRSFASVAFLPDAARTVRQGHERSRATSALRRFHRGVKAARVRDNALSGRYQPATDGKHAMLLRRKHEAAALSQRLPCGNAAAEDASRDAP